MWTEDCEGCETDMYRVISTWIECLSVSGNISCYSIPRICVVIFMIDFSAVISALLLFIALEVKHFVICLQLLNPKCYEVSVFWVCEKYFCYMGAVGRSLVRSQLMSLKFFIDIKSFRSHYGPGVDSASDRNEYQEHFLGVKTGGA